MSETNDETQKKQFAKDFAQETSCFTMNRKILLLRAIGP